MGIGIGSMLLFVLLLPEELLPLLLELLLLLGGADFGVFEKLPDLKPPEDDLGVVLFVLPEDFGVVEKLPDLNPPEEDFGVLEKPLDLNPPELLVELLKLLDLNELEDPLGLAYAIPG